MSEADKSSNLDAERYIMNCHKMSLENMRGKKKRQQTGQKKKREKKGANEATKPAFKGRVSMRSTVSIRRLDKGYCINREITPNMTTHYHRWTGTLYKTCSDTSMSSANLCGHMLENLEHVSKCKPFGWGGSKNGNQPS